MDRRPPRRPHETWMGHLSGPPAGNATHLSLNKDARSRRAIQEIGRILCQPILDGLHDQYGRI